MELNDLSTIYVRFYIVVLLYTINRDRRTFFAKYTCLALNLLTKGNSISRCSELQYCGGAVPGDQFAGRHMCATCSGSNYICIRNVGTTCALSIVNLYRMPSPPGHPPTKLVAQEAVPRQAPPTHGVDGVTDEWVERRVCCHARLQAKPPSFEPRRAQAKPPI